MKKLNWIVGVAICLAVLGCSQEAKNDMGQAADKTGAAISKTAESAEKSAANAMMTGKVKNAIMTANDVQIDGLNVDTIDKTITLKGVAKDSKSKETAAQIAKTQAGNDYKVDNQITGG
ncbi:MAG: BON domain-containing protein [Chlorobia bacterium]|nr:BON domain-containing protein [Fimbriimonadaceae bacterium]